MTGSYDVYTFTRSFIIVKSIFTSTFMPTGHRETQLVTSTIVYLAGMIAYKRCKANYNLSPVTVGSEHDE